MDELLLVPKTGQSFLEPREIVLRLFDTFAYVTVHRPTGEAENALAKQVEIMKRLGASEDKIVKWKQDHAPGAVLNVLVYNDPNDKTSFLRLILTSNHGIHLGWESKEHYKASKKLATRIKKVLDYVYGET